MPWAIKRHPRPVSATKRRISNRRRIDVKKSESILSQCVDIGGALPRTFTRATSSYNDVLNSVTHSGEPVRRAQRLLPGLRRIADRMIGSRTNLLAAGTSENFDITWSKTDITVTKDSAASPVIGETADLLTEGVAGTALIQQNFTITAASFISASLPFKVSAIATWIFVRVTSDAGVNGWRGWFNISTGVSGTQSVLGTGTATTQRIESMGNGWYRLVAIGKVDAAATACNLLVCSASADGSFTRVNSAAYLAWGAQVEQVAFPSSYISNRNLLLQSETLNTTWSKTDVTITSDSTANPLDGLVTADTCTEGVAGTANLAQAATIVAGSAITHSMYFKRGNTDWLRLVVLSGGTDGFRCWINLATGAVGTANVVGTGTYTSSSLTAVPGQAGWYRLVFSGKVAAAATSATFTVQSASADASGTRVNNATFIAYGAQLEYGTAATAYWATTTAVGLRAADSLTVDLSTMLKEAGLSVTAGTVIAILRPKDWTGDQDGSTAWTVWRMNDAQPSRCARNAATTLFVGRGDAGGPETATVTHALTNGAIGIIAMAYDATSLRGYVAGVLGASDATLTPPYDSGANVVIVGSAASGTQSFYGDVILLYKDGAVSAADLLNMATDIAAVAA